MELAANPAYRGSLYLSSFYRHYILKEDISCPRLPPYLQLNVLSVIEKAFSSDYDVIAFSTKKWYKYLMETDLTGKILSLALSNLLSVGWNFIIQL